MADPLWINAVAGSPAYSANEMRQAMALALQYDGRLLGARQGVRTGGQQLVVSLAGSTITVQPGVACVDPGLSTPQGPYWVAIPAAETPGPLAAADATNPRKDTVILRVYDNDEDLSGLRLARTEYLVGVAAPAPAEPAVPAGALLLAGIDVPKSGAGSPVVTDRRQFTAAAGGIIPVRTAGELTAAAAGQYRDRLDTGTLERHNGTAWLPMTAYKATQTLAVNAASITFTGIPSDLKVLDMRWTSRSTDPGFMAQTVWMRINGVSTSSVYRTLNIQSANASTSVATFVGAGVPGGAAAHLGLSATAGAPAGVFGGGSVRFDAWNAPHLNNLTWHYETLLAANDTAVNIWMTSGSGVYIGAGPYTSITLFPVLGSFAPGTQASLIGWS